MDDHLLEERGSTEEQQRLRAEVEVAVPSNRLLVALVAVVSHALAVEAALANVRHALVFGLVEGEVVSVG